MGLPGVASIPCTFHSAGVVQARRQQTAGASLPAGIAHPAATNRPFIPGE